MTEEISRVFTIEANSQNQFIYPSDNEVTFYF